jgi:arginyl-tRNA synthetase
MKDQIIKSLSKLTGQKEEFISSLIEVPKDFALGDYAFPCFNLSKQLKKNPVDIAKEIAEKLNEPLFEKVKSQGPYVNFFINRSYLAKEVVKSILKEREKYGSLNIKESAVIEFPSPNTNKPLHIGHARNIVLGQSVSNILRFCGNDLKTVNLNNDRGVHICKSMIAYEMYGKNDTPKKSKIKSDHFVGNYYVTFSKKVVEQPDLEKKAQEYLQKWERKDKYVFSLWKKMNSWALKGFNETYKKFNLKFDKEYFESDIYNKGKIIAQEALEKKVASKKSDGAIFINLSNEGLGEKIILRSDGTSIYITQDLFLAQQKEKDFKLDKSIIVSATEQNYHFKVLFSILKKLGKKWADKSIHLNYGMVNLESGRMKSREGNVVDSDDLIKELEDLASNEIIKRENIPTKESKKRAKIIALCALRYYFLKVDRIKDVVFKPEESISFEGDTGPYLLYTYARARSILSKAKYKESLNFTSQNISAEEKQLLLHLSKFKEIVFNSYNQLAPNLIANYTFHLAQLFNEFYHKSQVIGSKEEKFRLCLVDASSQVIKNALLLLGISTLEKM